MFLPGESQGRGSLVGCHLWGCTESDTTEQLHFTFHFPALEKEMATHYSVLAWRIPGTEEPGGLPSMGSHRVGHNWSDLAEAVAVMMLEVQHLNALGKGQHGSWSNIFTGSLLLMNTQGWFPLGLTDLIFLLFKRFSKTSFNTTVQKHQFFGSQPILWSNSHSPSWLLKNY